MVSRHYIDGHSRYPQIPTSRRRQARSDGSVRDNATGRCPRHRWPL